MAAPAVPAQSAAAVEAQLEEGGLPPGDEEDDEDEDQEEEIEDLPLDWKEQDPYFHANITNGEFPGFVEDIEQGKESKELLYRVRYDDGDLEHLSKEQILAVVVHRSPHLGMDRDSSGMKKETSKSGEGNAISKAQAGKGPRHAQQPGNAIVLKRPAGAESVAEAILVGARVKLKPSIVRPIYGWGSCITHSSIGIVAAIDGEEVWVKFKGHEDWHAKLFELKAVPEARPGDLCAAIVLKRPAGAEAAARAQKKPATNNAGQPRPKASSVLKRPAAAAKARPKSQNKKPATARTW